MDSHGVTRGSSQRAAAAPPIIPMTLPRLAKKPRARPDARARSSATTAMMSTISTGTSALTVAAAAPRFLHECCRSSADGIFGGAAGLPFESG